MRPSNSVAGPRSRPAQSLRGALPKIGSKLTYEGTRFEAPKCRRRSGSRPPQKCFSRPASARCRSSAAPAVGTGSRSDSTVLARLGSARRSRPNDVTRALVRSSPAEPVAGLVIPPKLRWCSEATGTDFPIRRDHDVGRATPTRLPCVRPTVQGRAERAAQAGRNRRGSL